MLYDQYLSKGHPLRVFIHAGHLSVDNGALYPLTQFSQLAELLQTTPNWGVHYGFDSVDIEESDWPTLQAILDEAKMLYRVDGQHDQWQNVLTDEVRHRLKFQFH